jgi:hypothetical protein
MKEFSVNKYIKLKLENDKTIIYISNERFDQCKYLLLDIPVRDITSLEDIDSIDDVVGKIDRSSEQMSIPPEIEFWGHCSNLQVWYENKYNTQLIHRNLAFPLLRKLQGVGDRQASKVFKEEIAKRFVEGNETVRQFLHTQGYLKYLNNEEFCSLLNDMKFSRISELIRKINDYSIVDRMTSQQFFEFIDSLDQLKLRSFVKNPKNTNRLNILQIILESLEDSREEKLGKNTINKILVKLNLESQYFDHLMNLILDKNNYINLSILESAIQINPEKVKIFLQTTKHRFRLGFDFHTLSNFQHILNPLLACFTPAELINFLEKNHRLTFFKYVFPKMECFRYLNMGSKINLDMKHYITAFMLEEKGGNFYVENLREKGDFIADIMLTELINIHGEVDERIKEALEMIGEDVKFRLEDKLYDISQKIDSIEEPYRDYLKRLGVLSSIDREEFCGLFDDIRFNSFIELLEIINDYSIIDLMTPQEFLQFVDSLRKEDFVSIIKIPEKTNRMNLLLSILNYLRNHVENRSAKIVVDKILNKIGEEYYDYLIELLVDNEHFINLPVLESLVQINPSKIKIVLNNAYHQFRFEKKSSIYYEFHHILNPLLVCFSPKELMTFLEDYHKDFFLKFIFPYIRNFKSLRMSKEDGLDMEQYTTAFLLEEEGGDLYIENFKKLGSLLTDILLSELLDINGEINEIIINNLKWIGGDAEAKLEIKLKNLSE